MSKRTNTNKYDLEYRTLKFAKDVRVYCRTMDRKDPVLWGDLSQLLRSSGSVGAKYIEASEALSKKDFIVRIKICRKEAKETTYWLRLLPGNVAYLIDESAQLTKIFGAILEKCK